LSECRGLNVNPLLNSIIEEGGSEERFLAANIDRRLTWTLGEGKYS
jgi:hypothetical protein